MKPKKQQADMTNTTQSKTSSDDNEYGDEEKVKYEKVWTTLTFQYL